MGNHQNDECIPLYLDIGPEHKASPVVATQLVVPTELSEVLYVQEVLSIVSTLKEWARLLTHFIIMVACNGFRVQ